MGNGLVAGMASEELDDPYRGAREEFERGRYLLVFDPLDGSSATPTSTCRWAPSSRCCATPARHRAPATVDYLRPGASRWPPATPSTARPRCSCSPWARARTASRSTARSATSSSPTPTWHSRRHQRVRHQHQQRPLLGAAGAPLRHRMPGRPRRRPRARLQHALDRQHGGRGAPHPDARRRVHVPQGHQGPGKPGRLRLLYEANPISFLIEQAGGRSTTGRQRLLDVTPDVPCTSACR